MLPGIVSNERVALIHVELSRLLQLYSDLEFEAKWFLGGLIHRRGIKEDSAPGRQAMARWERLPSQPMAGEMEELTHERFDGSPIRRVSQSSGRRESGGPKSPVAASELESVM